MGETYYDVLGVTPEATDGEIRAAYRERVLETHPDQNDDPDAAAAFERVQTAQSILTDEVERGRYDRLGHEAYVSLEGGLTAAPSSDRESGDGVSVGDTHSSATSARQTAGDSRTTETGDNWTTGTDDGWTTDTDRSGPSHHARQRRRRQRERANAQRTAEWFLEDDRKRYDPGKPEEDATEEGESDSGFSVHDWEGEVDDRRERPDLEQSTWVVVCVFTALYPALVYSSVTPVFPVAVNAIVAACTLALIGYLLTIPHVAVVAFGLWSVLVPVGLLGLTDLEILSVPVLGVLGAFWVPFGYAVVVRWALRR